MRWWVGPFLFCSALVARAADVIGPTYPIAEPDLLAWIEARWAQMRSDGEWDAIRRRWRERVRERLLHPPPVPGITTARRKRTFLVDPSIRIDHPIRDARGRIVAMPGVFDPLDHVRLHVKLLFLDGRDARQLRMLAEMRGRVKAVLVAGSPVELMRRLGVRLYYDQGGRLTRRLGIRHVPAIVEQEGRMLRVVETPPPGGAS